MVTFPLSGTRHAWRSTLNQNEKLVAAAYLRAAHAYMLISMPTGTSTIFGVFQAILALLVVNRTISALTADKLIGIEKFASEIFFHKSLCSHAASQKEFTYLCRRAVKPKMDQQVQTNAR